MAFAVVFALLVVPRVHPRAHEPGASEAASIGAHLRGHLETAAAALLGTVPDVPVALAATESVLVELTDLAHDSTLPEGGPLPGDVVAELADEAARLRAYALAQSPPLPEGFRRDFLTKLAPGALLGDWRYGVPASITLAQAILESGWGKVAPGYNLFGMKGQGTEGSSVHRVVEYQRGKRSVRKASFRRYGSFTESINDHSRLLGTVERYAAARAAGDNVALYARALQGKYATDPRYASKLLDLSSRYGLQRFDWVTSGALAQPTPPPPVTSEVSVFVVDQGEIPPELWR